MYPYPAWFGALLGASLPIEGGVQLVAHGVPLVGADGLLRDERCIDAGQAQTRSTFAFKWQRQESYGSEAMRNMSRAWLAERYASLWTHDAWSTSDRPLVLDAGCGSTYSAQILFEGKFEQMRYVGADISRAVDVAATRLPELGLPAALLQADLMALPFADETFDVVFSEGVLHHTPSTRAALEAVSRKLRKGGAFAFYIYRRKSPVREFTDDLIRDRLSGLEGQQAWDLLMPLTKLGEALGKLDATVDIPEAVDLLGIPAGKIDVQRLFYWHVCKLFYRADLSLEEMNHINFDWFTPKYAHRQSEDEVRAWCSELSLDIVDLKAEDAGLTVIATRRQ